MENLNQSGQNAVQIDDTNPITLLKNPDKFKDTFYELTSLASESLKSQEYEKAIKALNKCLDMMDLGKNILKDISKYWKVCLYGNLACAFQGTWKMPKCNKFCEKIEEELERLLTEAQCKQSYLNITKYIIKIKFQHCAILSQLSQHDKALAMCQSTLPTLQNYIETILEYTESLKVNRSQKKSSQTVHFSKHVCAFAQEILNNLAKCLKQPIKLNIDKLTFYYWQKNAENNERQVEKKFVSGKTNDSCKRSILGVNKMVHWIDEFNIGTIMHMSEMTVMEFEQTLPIEEYLFKDKLYETVIHCSIAHFTIATEMRFIQSNKQRERLGGQSNENNSQESTTVLSNIQTINKKYGYQQKSEMFKISEMYHLRAINIMAQNIKTTVPYISHLIKSYDKHYIYKKQLEPVIALAEESLMSISDTNQISINKKQFNSHQKIGSRVINDDVEGQHYFTNMNLAGLNIRANSQNARRNEQDQPNVDRFQAETDKILDELEEQPQSTREKHAKRVKNEKKHSLIKNQRQIQKQESGDQSSQSEQANMVPNYIHQDQKPQTKTSKNLHRHKSTTKNNKLKTVTSQKLLKKQQSKPMKKKETKQLKQAKEKKKKPKDPKDLNQQEFRMKHQSYTQIKVSYKKKK